MKRALVAIAVGLMAVMIFGLTPATATAQPGTSAQLLNLTHPSSQPAVTPAAPADGNCYGGFTADDGALACFVPYGEHLWVCDTAPDGHHPGVWYSINGGTWVNKQYDLRNGNCHDINLDIAESGYITFYAVNYEGPTALSYSEIFTVDAQG